jgi:hypothetical protein
LHKRGKQIPENLQVCLHRKRKQGQQRIACNNANRQNGVQNSAPRQLRSSCSRPNSQKKKVKESNNVHWHAIAVHCIVEVHAAAPVVWAVVKVQAAPVVEAVIEILCYYSTYNCFFFPKKITRYLLLL